MTIMIRDTLDGTRASVPVKTINVGLVNRTDRLIGQRRKAFQSKESLKAIGIILCVQLFERFNSWAHFLTSKVYVVIFIF